jgi:hypothetical protein
MAHVLDKRGIAGWLAWRAFALGISLVLASSLSGSPPLSLAASGVVIWVFLGGMYRQFPRVVAVITAFDVLLGAKMLWHLPWSVAWFVPVWAALFWLPALFRDGTPLARGMAWTEDDIAGGGGRAHTSLFRLSAEALRLGIAGAAGLFATFPFLHDGIVGGTDAKWYTIVVADHLQQWRTRQGPVFAGQTRYAAIGTVTPLRVAPYLQHLTLALDFLTGRHLSAYLLLNLAIVLSGVGAVLSAYICLRAIMPAKRLEALLLALLYLWCPAVIGLPYTGQLFMSTMALPYLPLVFVGVVLVFARDGFIGWALVCSGCAGCWLAHPPIGFWVTASAALALSYRWLSGRGWDPRELARIAGAAALFLGLCGYVFVSLHVLAVPDSLHTLKSVLLEVVRNAFPASLEPVSPFASLPSDLQLGWSLWLLLLACAAFAWASCPGAARALAVVCFVVACLALPVPGINSMLWNSVPQAIVDVTNAVPMQRLYPILAACSVVLAGTVLASAPRRGWAVLGLLIAVVWSAREMLPFRQRGFAIANTKAVSEDALRPETMLTARFSLGLLAGENRFYSEGVVDYEMEQRILGPKQLSYIATNVGAVAPGQDFKTTESRSQLPNVMEGSSPAGETLWVYLKPKLLLLPGEHYLLALDVASADWHGILQITGTGFYREYILPSSGGMYAFGSTHSSSRVIPLSTTSKVPVELSLAFINQDPGVKMSRYATFGRYDFIRYDPKDLPIRLKSLLPYVAEVRSPSAGLYESFRHYTPGWSATVNGIPAQVRPSLNGLIIVPVAAGESEVRLLYRPPPLLLFFYWVTWATWAGLAFFAVRRCAGGYFSWAARRRPLSLPSQ